MNILLKEIFAGIFVSIACWNRHYDFLECSDKSSKFNSFAFTLSAVLYLRVIGGTNFLFIDEWREYFASFYFRVWDLTREIRENKNPAKISTYTVTVTLILFQTPKPYSNPYHGPTPNSNLIPNPNPNSVRLFFSPSWTREW